MDFLYKKSAVDAFKSKKNGVDTNSLAKWLCGPVCMAFYAVTLVIVGTNKASLSSISCLESQVSEFKSTSYPENYCLTMLPSIVKFEPSDNNSMDTSLILATVKPRSPTDSIIGEVVFVRLFKYLHYIIAAAGLVFLVPKFVWAKWSTPIKDICENRPTIKSLPKIGKSFFSQYSHLFELFGIF